MLLQTIENAQKPYSNHGQRTWARTPYGGGQNMGPHAVRRRAISGCKYKRPMTDATTTTMITITELLLRRYKLLVQLKLQLQLRCCACCLVCCRVHLLRVLSLLRAFPRSCALLYILLRFVLLCVFLRELCICRAFVCLKVLWCLARLALARLFTLCASCGRSALRACALRCCASFVFDLSLFSCS